jgi:hypothetical protein
MLSKGFIVESKFCGRNDKDADLTKLQIEDLQAGKDHYDEDVVSIFIEANDTTLSFEYHELHAFLEALQDIFRRYRTAAEFEEATDA